MWRRFSASCALVFLAAAASAGSNALDIVDPDEEYVAPEWVPPVNAQAFPDQNVICENGPFFNVAAGCPGGAHCNVFSFS